MRFNYIDRTNSEAAELFRSKIFRVPDSNMFVTSFVLYGLLEASELKTIKIDDHQFSQSLMAIDQFRDKNSPSGLPQYSFWPQTLVNGTWSATPQNLFGIVNHILPKKLPFALMVVFQLIGLGVLNFAYSAKF